MKFDASDFECRIMLALFESPANAADITDRIGGRNVGSVGSALVRLSQRGMVDQARLDSALSGTKTYQLTATALHHCETCRRINGREPEPAAVSWPAQTANIKSVSRAFGAGVFTGVLVGGIAVALVAYLGGL